MKNSKPFSCCMIGEDSLLIQCANIILNKGHLLLSIVSPNPQVKQWAQDHNITCLDSLEALQETFRISRFDYLFGISNSKILSKDIINLPTQLAINYHNALLPRYAGVHAPSWAILNDEEKHGITWHVIVDKVDAGDILKQVEFTLDKKETALTLNLRCCEYAILAFDELIDELKSGKITRISQDLSKRSYFSLNKKPPRNGLISWNESAQTIDKVYRALTFGNYMNQLGLLKFSLGKQIFHIHELSILNTRSIAAPGTVIKVSENELQIATSTQDVTIHKISTLDGIFCSISEVLNQYKIAEGHQLPILDEKMAENLEKTATDYSHHENYWVNELAKRMPGQMPLSISSMKSKNFQKINSSHLLDTLYASLSSLSVNKVQDGQILLTAFLMYLYKINNYAIFTAQFTYPELQELDIELREFFCDQLPLTVQFEPTMTFAQALEQVSLQVELLKKHQTYSRDISLRYPQLNPRLAVMLMSIEIVKNIDGYQPKQLSPLTVVIAENGLEFSLFVNEDLLSVHYLNPFVKSIAEHILLLLEGIAKNPETNISRLPVLTPLEQQQILIDWNCTTIDTVRDKTIHRLFEEQVEKTPNHIAVVYGTKRLSYLELNQKANQLARYLKKQSLTTETLIAICAERSLEMIIGILAILKAGCAYVPLDPNYPINRLLYMLEDSKAPVLLISKSHLKYYFRGFKGDIIDIQSDYKQINLQSEINLEEQTDIKNLAYVLYTSGTTGRPKGVCITHDSLHSHMAWMLRKYNFTEKDVFLQKTPFSFDASVWEFFAPLLCGGQLVVAQDGAHSDPSQLVEHIINYKVTVLQLVPSVLSVFLEENKLNLCHSLKQVFSGGEALPPETIRLFFEKLNIKLHNLYGPTEATIDTVTLTYNASKPIMDGCLIGKPIDNTKVYVLDQELQPVPMGVTGELYIGGACLARGYLNQEELTKTKFISDPFDQKSGARLYKTGDLVRWLPQGNLEYLGRCDEQVKIRGYRIELGEIEACLLQSDLIRQCVVVVSSQNYSRSSKFLIAYLVLKKEIEFNETHLRNYLEGLLPEHMIPSGFIVLDKLPITPNGKVDRKMLCKSGHYPLRNTNQTDVAPTNLEEQVLTSIWQEVLEIKLLGIHDNFFDLGGHSLSAFRILKLIEKRLSVKLSVRTIFEFPTIALLANAVKEARQNSTAGSAAISDTPFSIISLQTTNSFNAPLFLLHPVGGTIFWYKTFNRYLGQSRPIYAIQDPGVDTHKFHFKSLEEMAAYYLKQIRQIQPRGPYYLAGASFGATLAVEIASQLSEVKEGTKFIGLLDGWAIYPKELDNKNYFQELMRKQNEWMGISNMDFLLKLQWHRKKLLLKYKVPVIDNKLTLFKAKELWPIFREIETPYNWWENHSTQPIALHHVPGNHLTIFWEPQVQVLAKEVLKCLDQIEVPVKTSESAGSFLRRRFSF